MAIRRKRRERLARDPEVRVAAERAERAERQLEHAVGQHKDQARKREQEHEGLVNRLDRLAQENHLASLVMDILQGK